MIEVDDSAEMGGKRLGGRITLPALHHGAQWARGRWPGRQASAADFANSRPRSAGPLSKYLTAYGIAEYDRGAVFGAGTKDVSVLAHEVLEWVNDPSTNNAVPLWGNIGQVSGCQNNLEVGDPLSGTLMPGVLMPNGVTYHAQELAFFSWFLGTPFAGAGGKYSSNGTFGGDAKNCPPGGTN
jgi:hypothetical protein